MAAVRSGDDADTRLTLLRRDLAELDQIADEIARVAAHCESAALRGHLRRIERLKLRLQDEMRRLMH